MSSVRGRLAPMPAIRAWLYWRTTAFRLTLLFSGLFAIGVIALLGLIYWQTAGYMTRQVDLILNVEAQGYLAAPESDLPRRIAKAVDDDARHIFFFGLFDSDGRVIAGNLPTIPADLPFDGQIHALSHRPDDRPRPDEDLVRAIGLHLASGKGLVIARDITQIDQIRRIIIHALQWWGSLILIIGIALGLAMSLRPLRRVAEIQRASHAIMLGDFRHRLPIAGRKDELDLLAGIVNSMLDEVERLMTEVKSVCDNIAHDLRTPLTRLRAQIYRIQQLARLDDPQRAMLDGVIADTDALLSRFRALLRISEIEDSRRRTGFAQVDLARIVDQLVDLYEPLAEEKSIRLHCRVRATPTVLCDGELLFEAVSNLLDNAIKFSPPSGVVTLSLYPEAAGPSIAIIDQGPGIAAAERDAILHRFYRSDTTRDLPGHGLGLSIVAAIVRLHQFDLRFEPADGGGTAAILRCASTQLSGF